MKVTMYELLGLVKDGKTPRKIKYDEIIFEYDGGYYTSKNNIILEEFCNLTTSLNDEVEIIDDEEHKIPEKLNTWYGIEPVNLDSPTTFKDNSKYIDFNTEMFFDKINEIIDYLEEIG